MQDLRVNDEILGYFKHVFEQIQMDENNPVCESGNIN